MKDFDRWFSDLSTQPLPGGVAASAVAAAMGAALMAKTARIALRRAERQIGDRSALEAHLDTTEVRQRTLLALAEADEAAYQAALEAGSPAAGAAARRQAVEIPIRLAEVCRSLLADAPQLHAACPPAVRPDLVVGVWLLEVGARAGREAAKSNLRAWTADIDPGPFQARLEALAEEETRD